MPGPIVGVCGRIPVARMQIRMETLWLLGASGPQASLSTSTFMTTATSGLWVVGSFRT